MKNFILSLCLVLIAVAGVQAQSVSKGFKLTSDVAGKTVNQAKKDTVTQASTNGKSQSIKLPGFYNVVSVQTQINRISGTAAGKAYLEGSLSTTTSGATWEKADSLTLANVAAQTKVFSVSPSKYVLYRVRVVPSGTQSLEFYSFGVARKN